MCEPLLSLFAVWDKCAITIPAERVFSQFSLNKIGHRCLISKVLCSCKFDPNQTISAFVAQSDQTVRLWLRCIAKPYQRIYYRDLEHRC